MLNNVEGVIVESKDKIGGGNTEPIFEVSVKEVTGKTVKIGVKGTELFWFRCPKTSLFTWLACSS